MRGLPGALPYQATDRDAYRMAYRRIKNYRRTAYRTECQTTLPEAYQMTTEKQTDILPGLLTEMATVHRDPTRCPIERCGIRICKAAFREQKRTLIAVSMTTYCESLCVRYGSMIYHPRRCNWRILPPSNGHQRVTYENRRL
jgi:hypothetical protein